MNRRYLHCDIRLQLAVVDSLKKWNKHSTVHYDTKFLKLLLVDTFGTKALKQSKLDTLDAAKMRFVRGLSLFCS